MTYEQEWMSLATLPQRLGRHRTRAELDRMNDVRELCYIGHEQPRREVKPTQVCIWEVYTND